MKEITHFVSAHGYIVLFLAVLAEQIGLPIPSGLVLIAVGSLAGLGSRSLSMALAIAVLASLIGDSFWFALGRWRGRSILRMLCKISLEPDSCVRRTEDLFTKNRAGSLLFSKFVPGLGTVASSMAAILRVGIGPFLLFDALGAGLWSSAYLLGGFFFRTEIERIGVYAQSAGASMAEIFLALVIVYVAIKFVARRRLYSELRMARITPAELRGLMESAPTSVIVDLRHPQEWKDGNIPGALLLSNDELDKELASIAPGAEIVLYCS